MNYKFFKSFNDNRGGAILYFLFSGNSRKYNAPSPLSLIFSDGSNYWAVIAKIRNSNDLALEYKKFNYFSLKLIILA